LHLTGLLLNKYGDNDDDDNDEEFVQKESPFNSFAEHFLRGGGLLVIDG